MDRLLRASLAMTLVVAALGLIAAPARAQEITLGPDFAADYEIVDLGTPPGVPERLGGLTLKRGDPDTLLIGGAANGSSGAIYEIGLERGADGGITGFVGTATLVSTAPGMDGGLAYEPTTGVLFYTGYSQNEIGQILPGSSTPDRIDNVTANGIASSVGSLAFVPAGAPGAGRLKVVSYNSFDFYDVPFTPDGNGTFELGAATQEAALVGGPEGLAYVPTGSPGFATDSILVSEYGGNAVAAYEVDPAGNPDPATRREFITDLTGAEGAYLDRGTGEFLFSTFGGGNRVIVVTGFSGGTPVTPVAEGNEVRVIAISISQFLFPEGGADGVLLARHDVFADALAGAPLGGETKPVLYTTGGADAVLDPDTREEIDRLLGGSGTVTVLGGDQAVSTAVAQELQTGGYTVDRISGPSRFETAAEIARRVLAANPGQTEAMLATGANFPDAVTGGAYGANFGIPILLTTPNALHAAAAAVFDEAGTTRTIVLGGTAVVSEAAANAAPGPERVAGPNRMDTAARVAFDLWGDVATNAVVVNLERVDSWAAALSAAILSASVDGAQLGTGVGILPPETRAYLENVEPTTIYVIGGAEFISEEVIADIGAV